MNMPKDYETTKTYGNFGNTRKIPAGGYVCKIKSVTIDQNHGNPIMRMEFDVAEGEYKEFYQRRYQTAIEKGWSTKWTGVWNLYCCKQDGSTNPLFKGFITAVEESNKCTLVHAGQLDEQAIPGKLVGILLGEKPFVILDQSTGKYKQCDVVKPVMATSVQRIRDNAFSVPKPKELTETEKALLKGYEEPQQSMDDDLPF